MQNFFTYFTEIEERFQQRRGTLLMLSTLDWALIDSWREAGVPLSAVLSGIDEAFAKRESRQTAARGRTRKINGLAWCAQSVMEAAERHAEAAVGIDPGTAGLETAGLGTAGPGTSPERETGFEQERLRSFLFANAESLAGATLPEAAAAIAHESSVRLRELAAAAQDGAAPALEALDGELTALEARLVAALVTATPAETLLALRREAAGALAPYRGKMKAVQIRQVEQQFLERHLLRDYNLPRLSLFYMSHE